MIVELHLFDDSLLEVGEEEGLLKARVFDGFFVDTYDPEETVDVIHRESGGKP